MENIVLKILDNEHTKIDNIRFVSNSNISFLKEYKHFGYNVDFYNDGEKNVNAENGTGIIRSSAFILEKNGIISFRFGAAHNREVYINVYTAGGKLLATFRNNAYTQDTVMVQYYYEFDNAEEVSCYFEVVDNAIDDYGCIVMDDFRVNLESVPTDAVLGSDKTKAELTSAE